MDGLCFLVFLNFSLPSGDLNHMHRTNEESYRNAANDEQIQDSMRRNGHTPGFEGRSPLSHQMSGCALSCSLFIGLFIRSTYSSSLLFTDRFLCVSLVLAGFTDLTTPQQLHRHDTYKEALKQQVSLGPQLTI